MLPLLLTACTSPEPDPQTPPPDPTGCETRTFFADADDDGYGDATSVVRACQAPTGFVDDASDCAPDDPSVHPGATEICNAGIDDDCNGLADDDDPGVDPTTQGTWLADLDGDTFGDPDAPLLACEPPADHVLDDTDCDDSDATVHPGAPEHCDGRDEDCDPSTPDVGVWWRDDASTWADHTAAWQAGTPEAPVDIEASGPGTLFVCAGTYHTRLRASQTHELNVSAPDGPALTFLDGGYDLNGEQEALLQADEAAAVQVDGLTLRNAYSAVDAYDTEVTLSDAVVTATHAKAISQVLGQLTLSDVQLVHNTCDVVLRAVDADVIASDTTITDNTGAIWLPHATIGGIVDLRRGTVDVDTLTLTDNTSIKEALVLRGVDGTLRGLTIEDHSGAVRIEGGTLTLEGATLSGNRAEHWGAAVRIWGEDSHVAFVDSVLSGNTVYSVQGPTNGGAVAFLGTGSLSFTDTLISGSEADVGAAVHVAATFEPVAVTCTGSTKGTYGFVDNTSRGASSWEVGAAVHLDGYQRLDDSSEDVDARITLDVTDCDFGTPKGGDANNQHDVRHDERLLDCNPGPACVRTDTRTDLDHDDDATFCVGPGCP
ncbi:MAG: putative metal-binding motif-containing protein [Myxococcales bacterium]|nr:putative metal-binding motif-containing protein [Myxococcales bacterium]